VITHTINEFLNSFTGIQVQIDWVKLLRHAPKVEMHELTTPEQLNNVYLPWYRTNTGIDVPLGTEGSRLMSAVEAATELDRFPNKRRCNINYHVEKYKADSTETLLLPAYKLSHDSQLLLDGNHRTVAIAVLGRHFRLVIATIVAPIDAAILPDLAYWTRG
jgi:hypothetical protein